MSGGIEVLDIRAKAKLDQARESDQEWVLREDAGQTGPWE
jgi:hypothetical protein